MSKGKQISMSLDPKSIDKVIGYLNMYANGLQAKANRLGELIGEHIAWSASKGFSTSVADAIFFGGTPKYSNVNVSVDSNGSITVVIAEGEEAVFIEFGAGVYFNGAAGNSPHPWGEQNGFLIGEYGKGLGKRNAWALPANKTGGQRVLTRGTPAAMPMYHGVQDALAVIDELARRVFGP